MVYGQGSLKVPILCGVLAATLLLLPGCGKNLLAPTEPDPLTTQELAGYEGNVSLPGSLNAECQGRGQGVWNRALFRAYLLKLTPEAVKETAEQIAEGYFTDPAVQATVKRVVHSKLFHLIVFKFGLGPKLAGMCLEILCRSWFPGLGSSPNGFDNEITLFPKAWTPGRGFYGDLLTAWGNGSGYHILSTNPAGETSLIATQSYPGNIYNNERNFSEFTWTHRYTFANQTFDNINLDFLYYGNRLIISSSSEIKLDGNRVFFGDFWVSTADESAHCVINSFKQDIVLELTQGPDGAGEGYLTLPNVWGQINRFEFAVNAKGHGYWTKNGGRRHPF